MQGKFIGGNLTGWCAHPCRVVINQKSPQPEITEKRQTIWI
jgi:hypothetical protein